MHGVSSELAAHFTATFYNTTGVHFRYDFDRAVDEGLAPRTLSRAQRTSQPQCPHRRAVATVACHKFDELLVASLLLLVRPSSILFLVVMPGATSSVLATV